MSTEPDIVLNSPPSGGAARFARPDISFSPDGTSLAASVGQAIKLWRTADGSELKSLATGGARKFNFTPDGKKIVSHASRDTLAIWDVASGTRLQSLPALVGFPEMEISPDGRRLFTQDYNSSFQVWDIESGRLIFSPKGNTENVSGTLFSPDGAKLATRDDEGMVKLWNLETGKGTRVSKVVAGSVPILDFFAGRAAVPDQP